MTMALDFIVWEWSTDGENWTPYMPMVSNYIETSHLSWKSNQSHAAVYLGVVDVELTRINLDLAKSILYDNVTGQNRICLFANMSAWSKLFYT